MSCVGFLTVAPVYWDTEGGKLDNPHFLDVLELMDLKNAPDPPEITFEPQLTHKIKQKVVETPIKPKFIPLQHFPPNLDKNYFNFPFFMDKKTVEYISDANTKVMFIMRGLSGSGKSTIVSLIHSVYEHVVTCSADDYFYRADGKYVFDEKLLSSAHESCQQKAKQACQNEVPIIVIDNTNVRKWEIKFYAEQASAHGYVAVKVQPRTPWQWNALELAARNKHGNTPDVLQRKILKFDDIIPAYYGWFPNEGRSKSLIKLSADIFLECLSKIPQLQRDFLKECGIKLEQINEETAKSILSQYYFQQSNQSPLLHCTAKYCAWGKQPGTADYHKRSDVQEACGRMFRLMVTGLVITKRTLGARVTLDPSTSVLFDRPEEKEWDPKSMKFISDRRMVEQDVLSNTYNDDIVGKKSNGKGRKRIPRSQKKKNKTHFFEKSDEKSSIKNPERDLNITYKGDYAKAFGNNDIVTDFPEPEGILSPPKKNGETVSLSEMFPSLNYANKARSAHFTVKTVKGAQSRDVNFDILHACDVETASVHYKSDFIPILYGQACYYGNGLCCVYFDKPIRVRTLFSGYY